MTPTFRIGRVAGIEVSANWTWLVVPALLVVSLATSVFPAANPGLSDTTYVAMALTAALLFVASLLLHELGHSVQARRDGVEIDGITLWLLGGVARFRGSMPSAGAELRIAAAGPAVSLVIAVTCIAAAVVAPLPAALDGVVHWLGYINFTLLAFNLIPAFPLDGGRLLRALLWRASGDLERATRIAAGIGRGFGIAMMVAGFFAAFLGGALGGLWLALIGFFLVAAAEAELAAWQARTALSGIRVADVMVREPVTVAADLTLRDFIDDVFMRHRHTAYPVVAGDEVLGLVSFRDVLDVPPQWWDSVRVGERTRPLASVPVVDAGRDLTEAVGELAGHDLHRALVLVDGRPASLLSMTDVARVLETLAAANAESAAVPTGTKWLRPRHPSTAS
jgi:Zn-dependent protease/CBS domain-containing protein